MTANSQASASDLGRAKSKLLSSLGLLLGVFRAKAALIVRDLQTARMEATLSNMSDVQLEQIGITRAGIPEYASRLMGTE